MRGCSIRMNNVGFTYRGSESNIVLQHNRILLCGSWDRPPPPTNHENSNTLVAPSSVYQEQSSEETELSNRIVWREDGLMCYKGIVGTVLEWKPNTKLWVKWTSASLTRYVYWYNHLVQYGNLPGLLLDRWYQHQFGQPKQWGNL